MKIFLPICFVLLLTGFLQPNPAPAQQTRPDSLRAVLQTQTEADTTRAKTLINLCQALMEAQPETALEYGEEALQLSRRLGYRTGVSKSCGSLGLIYKNLGQYEQALDYFENSLLIDRELGFFRGQANNLNNIGLVYLSQGQYKQALVYFQKSLKCFEQADHSSGRSNCLKNIGLIYFELKQYDRALEYHQQSLELEKQVGDLHGQAYSMGNISNVYAERGQNELALDYLQASLKLFEQVGDLYGQANCLGNIGLTFRDLGQFEQALDYLEKARVVLKQLGTLDGQANCLISIGQIHTILRQYDRALDCIHRGLTLADSIGHMYLQGFAHQKLAETYASKDHWQKAFEHRTQQLALRDSLFSREKTRAIEEMEAKYQTEKKDLQIKAQTAQLEKQQQRNQFLIGIGSTLLLLFLLAGYGYFDKRRTSQKLAAQKQEIEQAYEEIKSQKETIESQHTQLTEAYGEIQQRNEELAISIETIRNQQQQLIDSEKQALLGRVAAGVAHELNTPLGAIGSSAQTIGQRLRERLPDLPTRLQAMPPEACQGFAALLAQSMRDTDSSISTREERTLVRTMGSTLEPHFGPAAISLARTLVRAQFREVPPALLQIRDAELAQDTIRQVQELRQVVTLTGNIRSSVEKTSKIVDALRQLTRRPEPVAGESSTPVAETLREVLGRYENYFRKGIEVETRLDDTLTLPAQREDLIQLWTQIVFNAIQAMAESGRLSIQTVATDAGLTIHVTDTGPGIPEEIEHRVFDPMFTTRGEGEGTGIGLFVAQSIAQRYGGTISFTSQPGETTFTVRFPYLTDGTPVPDR